MNANASNGRSTASLGRGVFHVGKVLLGYYYPVEEWQIQVTLIRLCHLKQNAMGRITLFISISFIWMSLSSLYPSFLWSMARRVSMALWKLGCKEFNNTWLARVSEIVLLVKHLFILWNHYDINCSWDPDESFLALDSWFWKHGTLLINRHYHVFIWYDHLITWLKE